jgi:hypothetical protein
MSVTSNLSFFNEQDRIAFEQLKASYPNNVISQSYLRQAQPLTNGQGAYQYSLVNPQGGNTPLPNKLLNVTDLFLMTRLGFYLLKQVTTSGVVEVGAFELQTYPNPTYFPAVAGPPAFNPQDLEVIYNGNFSLTVNNILLINAGSMKRFRVVPQTQQSATIAKSEIDLSDALVPVVPYPVLVGTQSIQLQVNVPVFTGMEIQSVTAGTEYQLVCYAEGFLVAQGSAVGQN